MCGLADGGERLDEFRACALAVGDEPRDVATVDAAAGDEQVVSTTAGDATHLHLASSGSRVSARRGACDGETRVTLNALARGVELIALRFFFERAGIGEEVFDDTQGVDRGALHLFHAPLARLLHP